MLGILAPMVTAIAPSHPLPITEPAGRVEALSDGVIEEARRRQRRRRLRAAVAFAAIAVGVVAYLVAHADQPTARVSRSRDERTAFVVPAAVFSQPPYMGVACATPNGIACDRVGLAIWLWHPASFVSATIAGRALKLDWAGDRPPRFAPHRPRTAFDGFLQPAGLINHLHTRPDATSGFDPACNCQAGPIWLGENAPSPLVKLRIDSATARPSSHN